jgi:hypothetical protein
MKEGLKAQGICKYGLLPVSLSHKELDSNRIPELQDNHGNNYHPNA